MKNIHNIDKLENLPKKEKMNNSDDGGYWIKKGSTHHPVDGLWPWERIRNLCEANIGKRVDKIFSIYCKQVPIYQQDYFLDEFRENKSWRINKYYIDKQGRIQKIKKPKKDKSVYFYSDDYRTELVHKETGNPLEKWEWGYDRDKYEYRIVEGEEIKFSSKNDPEFIRLTRDQEKRKRAYDRKNIKEKEYSFISRKEEEKKAEKKEDKVKIEAKGFDYKTSFRTEKQIHPDTIKEGQGLK